MTASFCVLRAALPNIKQNRRHFMFSLAHRLTIVFTLMICFIGNTIALFSSFNGASISSQSLFAADDWPPSDRIRRVRVKARGTPRRYHRGAIAMRGRGMTISSASGLVGASHHRIARLISAPASLPRRSMIRIEITPRFS